MRKLPYYLVFIAALFFSTLTSAQETVSSYLIRGAVHDAASGEPLLYATVSVFGETEQLLTGALTGDGGKFVIAVESANLFVEVNYLGYQTLTIDDISFVDGIAELGTLQVSQDQRLLEEVVVSAEKSQTTFQLDKRVFNVGTDLSSAGGSAMDILVNVPSVDVNIEGEVSLRGNTNVQILINGKPSVIASGNALGSITADMIDRVEVITNPSAKYDAEGTTGILNIVLKKEEKKDLNGSISINTGSPANHSLGFSMNQRTEKLNLFSQFGIGKRTFLSDFNGVTIDRTSATSSELYSVGDGEKNEKFINFILGADYYINPLNVITLSGHYGHEWEDEFSTTNFELLEDQVLSGRTARNEVTNATNPKWQYEWQYERSFEDSKEHVLLASATGSFFGKNQNSNFQNRSLEGAFTDFQQDVINDFRIADYNFQVDYTHPFTEKKKLELGAKYLISDNATDYVVDDLIDGVSTRNMEFTNEFEFDQRVLGVYATYGIEYQKWSVLTGLRLENTEVETLLVTGNVTNSQNYTNLFPTFHTSYKVNDDLSLQLGYSRRIARPDGWDVNPFPTLANNLNLRTGNPDLLPEYTDSFEFSSIRDWDKATLNVTVYYAKTTDVVSRIVQVSDTLSISMPQNVGTIDNTGLEVNGQVEPVKWLSVSADLNWTYFKRFGVFESQEFNFDNQQWNGRLTTKLKLPKELTVEFRLRHQSKVQRIQSESRERTFLDMGLRKKLAKGRAVINLSVRDVFSTRRFIDVADQPDFFSRNDRIRNGRQIVLGLSWGFGKGDAMEFSGHKQF